MPEIVMANGHPGGELDDLAEGGLGFAQTAELPPDDANVVEDLRARRIENQGPFKGGERFLGAIQLAQRRAKVRP